MSDVKDGLGDAWDWTKGAAEDIWGGVTGQSDFKATPYDQAKIQAAQAPWLDTLDKASKFDAATPYQTALARDASELQRANNPIYDKMGNLVSGFDPNMTGDRLESLAFKYGKDATTNASNIEKVAGAYGTEAARQAAGLESLAGEVAGAPSYADAASQAAMNRAAVEANARAASARGANAALQMREAAAANAGAARLAASDAGALKAKEMADRYAQRGDLMARAAGVTGQTAATQGQLYGAAGGQRQQAASTQGELFGAAGDQRRTGMQAGVDALNTAASGRRDDKATSIDALTSAADIGIKDQQRKQDAASNALTGATQGQQLASENYNAAQNINSGVAANNAAGTSKALMGIATSGGSLLAEGGSNSDIRAKTDIRPLSRSASDLNDIYQDQDFRGPMPTDWSRPGTPVAPGADARGSSEKKKNLLPMVGKALMMMSDERSKTNIDPIVRMALSPDGNREALEPVKPYSYRYRPAIARAIGDDGARRAGVMAQDLERSEAGREVVNKGPGLKTLDRDKMLSFSLAGVAGLDKRLARLERAAGGTAPDKRSTRLERLARLERADKAARREVRDVEP